VNPIIALVGALVVVIVVCIFASLFAPREFPCDRYGCNRTVPVDGALCGPCLKAAQDLYQQKKREQEDTP